MTLILNGTKAQGADMAATTVTVTAMVMAITIIRKRMGGKILNNWIIE